MMPLCRAKSRWVSPLYQGIGILSNDLVMNWKMPGSVTMQKMLAALAFAVLSCAPATAADRIAWPATLPVYDHIVVVIEENKDVEQIFGSRPDAPYIRKLAAE